VRNARNVPQTLAALRNSALTVLKQPGLNALRASSTWRALPENRQFRVIGERNDPAQIPVAISCQPRMLDDELVR